jgi:hypothetical protein
MKRQLIFIVTAICLNAASSFCSAKEGNIDSMSVVTPETTTPHVRSTQLLSTPLIREESFTLSGQTMDAETGESTPYVSIRIEKLGLFTVSNEDGKWTLRLPASASSEDISFKYLGYTTQTIRISHLPANTNIYLKSSSVDLQEVVITPDKKFEVLRGAWNAIANNYPVEPTRTQGFYRETQRVNDSLFLYFNEAVLNVYKNTYRNTQNFGQIEVERSRKNVFPGIDSINDVRFYGGPHFPNELDVVFSRWDFINPSQFKNWSYDLEGGYSDNGRFIIILSFKHKYQPMSNFQGTMYIDADSYAYLGFEIKRFGLATFNGVDDLDAESNYVSGTTNIDIGYIEKGNRYFLSHINYKTNGINMSSRVRVYKDIEYVTTSILTDAAAPIPYDRQFDYTDILSIKADNYDEGFWKDYNILQESQLQTKQTQLLYGKEKAIEQLTKVYNTELTEQERVLLFLKRFTFDGGLSYHPLQNIRGRYVIGYGTDPLTLQNPPTGEQQQSLSFGISTTDGLRFQLNKKWSLFGNVSTALYGLDQLQASFGINYRTPLFPSGRWIFLDLGFGPDIATSRERLGTLDISGGSLTIGNKTLEGSTLAVSTGQNMFGAIGKIGVAIRMGKQYELFAEGNYQLHLLKDTYVQFKEKEGFFLTRSKSNVDWNDSNLYFWLDEHNQGTFSRMSSPTFSVEPWYVRLGIRSGF